MPLLHGADQGLPGNISQQQKGHGQQAHAHHHELQEIGDQHRQHAADDRIAGDAQQQKRHRDFEMFAIEPAHDHQKVSPRAQKDPHVQQPAQHDHQPAPPADARAESLLEQLGDRQDA